MRKTLFTLAVAAAAMLPTVAQAQCDVSKVVALSQLWNATACQTPAGGPNQDYSGAPSSELLGILGGASFFGGTSDLQYLKFDEARTTLPTDYNFGFNVIGDFAFSVKQGNNFTVFMYNYADNASYSGVRIFSDFRGEEVSNDNATSHGTLIYRQQERFNVPEPTSLGLLAAGMAGLGFMARRRRNA